MSEIGETSATCQPSRCARWLALVEVTLVIGAIILGWWLLKTYTGVGRWERDVFGYSGILVKNGLFILLPVLIIVAARRELAEYGIRFENLGYHVKIGLITLAAYIPFSFAFPAIEAIGASYRDPIGALILSVAHIAALFLIGWLLLKRKVPERQSASFKQVGVFLLVVAGLIGLSALTYPATRKISLVTHLFIATGFGEEIVFRGYVQSRLNAVFKRRISFFAVPCGWGMVIASGLFGLMHWFNPDGTVWWAVWTFAGGLMFGFVREKTGSIVAGAILHGIPLTIVFLLRGSLG